MFANLEYLEGGCLEEYENSFFRFYWNKDESKMEELFFDLDFTEEEFFLFYEKEGVALLNQFLRGILAFRSTEKYLSILELVFVFLKNIGGRDWGVLSEYFLAEVFPEVSG